MLRWRNEPYLLLYFSRNRVSNATTWRNGSRTIRLQILTSAKSSTGITTSRDWVVASRKLLPSLPHCKGSPTQFLESYIRIGCTSGCLRKTMFSNRGGSLKCLRSLTYNFLWWFIVINVSKFIRHRQAAPKPTPGEIQDVEDLVASGSSGGISISGRPVVTSKRKRIGSESGNELEKSWREILGPPPPLGKTFDERDVWIRYHKRKWSIQMKQRVARRDRESRTDSGMLVPNSAGGAGILRSNLGGFLRRAQQTLLSSMWQILQVFRHSYRIFEYFQGTFEFYQNPLELLVYLFDNLDWMLFVFNGIDWTWRWWKHRNLVSFDYGHWSAVSFTKSGSPFLASSIWTRRNRWKRKDRHQSSGGRSTGFFRALIESTICTNTVSPKRSIKRISISLWPIYPPQIMLVSTKHRSAN